MNELIKVTQQNGKQAVSARELHQFLGSKQHFSTWINNRIDKYKMREGRDYEVFCCSSNKINGGRPLTEYTLTIGASIEMAIAEKNEKGNQIRRYFIEQGLHGDNIQGGYVQPFNESLYDYGYIPKSLKGKIGMGECEKNIIGVMGHLLKEKKHVDARNRITGIFNGLKGQFTNIGVMMSKSRLTNNEKETLIKELKEILEVIEYRFIENAIMCNDLMEKLYGENREEKYKETITKTTNYPQKTLSIKKALSQENNLTDDELNFLTT